MTIRKIHVKNERVHIEWTKPSVKDGKAIEDPYMMTCSEPAHPLFYATMDALKDDVVTICDLGDGYSRGLKVIGITFSHKDENWGVVITALKTLKTCNSPFIIHTPFKWAESDIEENKFVLLPASTIGRLNIMIDHAEKYIGGERAQLELGDRQRERDETARAAAIAGRRSR